MTAPRPWPARGIVAGQYIDTTVDSVWARDHLAATLGERVPDASRVMIAHWRKEFAANPGSPSHLAALTQACGSADLVTLLFLDHFASEATGGLHADYLRELESIRRDPRAALVRDAWPTRPIAMAFAPGWLYRSHATTGADFARQRALLERLGFPVRFLAVDENGSVEANGDWLAREIRELRREIDAMIVVTGSKSAPEVALALGSLLSPSDQRHVRGWINVGGALGGTPLAAYFLRPPARWLARALLTMKGLDFTGLRSMRTDVRRKALASLKFRDDLTRVSYLAAPLSGCVSAEARDNYRRIRAHGPNDGLTLLADGLIPGGDTIFQMGTDHYFRSPDADLRTVALVRAVTARVGV